MSDNKQIQQGRNPDGTFAKGNKFSKGRQFSLVRMLERKLQEIEPETKESYADLLIKAYIGKAVVGGSDKLLRDAMDRIDGKALATLRVEDNETTNEAKQRLINKLKFNNDQKSTKQKTNKATSRKSRNTGEPRS